MKNILLPILLLLTACTPLKPAPVIRSGFTCGRLCWDGIAVGTTTREDLLEILADHPDVVPDSIVLLDHPAVLFDEGVFFSLYEIKFGQDHLIQVDAHFIDEKLAKLTFRGELSDDIQSMIDEFGQPEKVFTIFDMRGELNVDMIGFQEGVRYSFDVKDAGDSVLPDMQVEMIDLFNPDYSQLFLESGYLTSSSFDSKQNTLYDWGGYGKIEEKYWSPRSP